MFLLICALILDLIVGDPDWLWRRLPHPVVLFGKVIDWFDERRGWFGAGSFEKDKEAEPGFVAGLAMLAALLFLAMFIAALIHSLGIIGWVIELFLVAVLVAQKSLYDHVKRVADALRALGVRGGREAVSMIVGRDVSQLDESGVSKAAIESLAENFSDGVVAPVFWYCVFGLPGMIFYKAVNTADSMVGHHTQRHENFGKAAAVLDDWMNWPAARLSSLLVYMAVMVGKGGRFAGKVWRVTRRDAGSHRSPNAGWPESSFAAALGLSLGGPRRYGDDVVEADALYAEGRDIATVSDIDSALALFLRSCFCLIALVGLIWLVFG